MLLHWCTLEPSGPSNLAAVRFTSPICVHSIRIFPTGAKPFAHCPEVIARTEPDAFFLDVYFNAQSISPESKNKQRAPNALVPTMIAYAGGKREFTVDMGIEYATRLMIVKGDFQSVSMAIYGEVASGPIPLPDTYEPRAISPKVMTPLSRPVDPSHAADPTLLAKELLSLIPDAPPLSLVIRLMFCLKPSDDDWESPEFPFLFNDLDDSIEDFDLEQAFHCTSRPVADNISRDSICKFAEKIASALGPKSCDQSSLVAGMLSQVAPQHPDMSLILMENLDFELIFDAHSMDESTLSRLLDAAANFDIARHLNMEWFLDILHSIQEDRTFSSEAQTLARRLCDRIRSWQVLEDALSNTQADFHTAFDMIKDICREENSFGIWMESMTTHPDILMNLAENPVLPNSQCPHPLLHFSSTVSHDDFITFLRAHIGVSCVLAVYAWSDSLPNARCRERTLGILRLWQGVDGYREIVNHLLLLRQMVFRLECLTENHDTPSPSSVHVEHILVSLLNDPHSLSCRHLVRCVLSLEQPLSYITEEERLTMRKLALLAESGLPAALDNITASGPPALDIRNLRILRVSIASIERELDDKGDGELRVLETLWEQGWHGLISRLVDLFVAVGNHLKSNFLLTPPPRIPQMLVEQLFRTTADLLQLITHLIPACPLLNRTTVKLTVGVADLFTYTDDADMTYSQSSSACFAAQVARQSCIDLVRCISDPLVSTDRSDIVLRTLLRHGVNSDERDPAYHLLQVYYLIDHLLPQSTEKDGQQLHWVISAMPNILTELGSFFRALDIPNKVHLIKRLVNLDDGVTGIGEWLFLQELNQLSYVLQSLGDDVGEQHRLVRQYEAWLSLQFISEIVKTSSNISLWCVTVIGTHPEVALVMMSCLMTLVDGYLSSSHVTQIAHVLASNSATFDASLRFVLVLLLLRELSTSQSSLLTSLHILRDLPEDFKVSDRTGPVIERIFMSLATSESCLEGLNVGTAELLLSILEWFSERHTGSIHIRGVTASTFAKGYERIKQVLPSARQKDLEVIQVRITLDEGDHSVPQITNLVERVEISIQDIQALLHPPTQIPSTPQRVTPDVLGLVTASSPTALLRSPAATGLTKTYLNNDFRQLRQLPSARQNTSRLPSMHVDDFESSPVLASVPMPEVFPDLSPTFNIL